MTNFEILKEYINNQISKIDERIQKYDHEEIEQNKLLEELIYFINILETDIEKIDLELLSSILNKFQTVKETEYDINKLKESISLYKYLINPQIPNRGVKKEILEFLDVFKNKLRNYYNYYSVNDRQQKQSKLLEIKTQYNEFLLLFSDLSSTGCSLSKMNEFFDFLEKSSIDREIVLSLISTFTKNNVDYYGKRGKLKESIVEKKIDENARKVFDELKSNVLEDSLLLEEEVPSHDVSLDLTEEEKEILSQVENLINLHRGNSYSKVDSLVAVQLFNDLTVNTRDSLYFQDNNINWDFIVVDYEINLKKNIFSNRDEVFTIFKFIIQKNDEIEKLQIEKTEDKNKFFDLRNQYQLILDNSASVLYDFYQLQPNVQNLYNMVYKKIIEGDLEEAKNIAPHLQIEKVAFVGNLKEMQEYLQIIDLEDIDLTDLKEIINDLKKYMDKYNNYKLELDKISLDDEEIVEQELNLSESFLDYDKTKNLILLLKDRDGSFKAIKDIEEEKNKDILADKENEFLLALQNFATRKLEHRKKELQSSILTCTTSSKKVKSIKEEYGFDAERLRFSKTGRTSYIIIPVHEENQKKLRNFYGENIFENFGSIIMIINSIYCQANHANYGSATDAIKHNCEYINNVIDAFAEPNTDIKKLTNIIEESMSVCQQYIHSACKRR